MPDAPTSTRAGRARRRASADATPRTYLFPLDLIPETDGSWTVDVPDLPGCVTWGKTLEDALQHAQEAISLYIADLREERRPIPASVDVAARPVVAVTV